MTRLTLLAALVVVALCTAGCSQQETPQAQPSPAPDAPGSPESITLASVEAMQALDYDSLVELMHPEALASLKGAFDNVLRYMRAAHADTSQVDPAMPEAFRQIIAQDEEPTPKEFVRALLKGLTNATPEMKAMMEPMLKNVQVTVVGTVYEGDSLAHVMVRKNIAMMGVEMNGVMEVISLKQDNGNWRVTLTADLQRLSQTMGQGLMQLGAGSPW